jgi:hypothetical protein
VRPRWRKIVKRILIGLSVIVLIVGSIAAWAVNRYLIEHVQIADVSTYEATVERRRPRFRERLRRPRRRRLRLSPTAPTPTARRASPSGRSSLAPVRTR